MRNNAKSYPKPLDTTALCGTGQWHCGKDTTVDFKKPSLNADYKINWSKRKKQPKFAWLNEVNAQSYLATLDNLDKAFFKGNAKHSRFKSKKSNWHSYQNPQHIELDTKNNRIKIPKIGWVKCKVHRMVKGNIKTCTIKLHPSGKFTVSVLFDTQEILPDKTFLDTDKIIGLDLGIKAFVACSDQTVFENPQFLEQTLKKLNRHQRILSRKQKGSNNRSKQRLKVAKLHEKVSHQRNDYLHQITHKLVCESQAVGFVIEDLNVKGLIQNKNSPDALQMWHGEVFCKSWRISVTGMAKAY